MKTAARKLEVMDTAPSALEVTRATTGARLKEILDAAQAEAGGNLVRNLRELQGIRHVLVSRRVKARLAAGEPEARVRRRVDEALDDQEDLVASLTAEARGLEQQLAAAQTRREATGFERAGALMAEIDTEMVGSPEMRALFAWLQPFHSRALEVRTMVVALSGNVSSRVPDRGRFLTPDWTVRELLARAARIYEERHGKGTP
jgi:hypothetical protein